MECGFLGLPTPDFKISPAAYPTSLGALIVWLNWVTWSLFPS